jgi:hypothetical protein
MGFRHPQARSAFASAAKPTNEAAVFDRITERSPGGGVMARSWASMPPQYWPSTW